MTTRPGYIWSGTEWVSIGQEAVVAPVAYQASAPSSPATGDIWIDSDDDVPSVNSTLYYRWKKTMSGGETSVSGTDDNSLTLAYTAGYESVFINGVLQVRGSDYTATTGTSVTGMTALTAGDIVMVESVVAYSVGDTYTQSTLDGKFATQVDFPAGAWTAYTPTLTNVTLGNGTMVASYKQIGKTVVFKIEFTFGTTTSFSGFPSFSLPVTAVNNNLFSYIGNVHMLDAGTQNYIGLTALDSTTKVTPIVINASGTYATQTTVSATVPFTWGNADSFRLNGIYEAV